MIPLPDAFLRKPLAHRALHDTAAGRPENSRAAVRAAIDAGYGIEIDLQLSADGVAMVFHDYKLERLTGETGLVRERTAADLAKIRLAGGGPRETIPTLADILALVGTHTPLLIELKDQSGTLGTDTGVLEAATATACAAAPDGAMIAVMSFNPESVRAMRDLAPDLPRGLTTQNFAATGWGPVSKDRLAHLTEMRDYGPVGAGFISHDVDDLTSPVVSRLKSEGAKILCWTVKSLEAEARARRVAHNITFEGYLAPFPAA
ncbi:glycerophosphodiester phosphodiesterase family protein [Ovoidimarina sediminis]|uniref:glycerophosphodiester phosphodiesterase family protein n=1 Tax=Ovoidimarina sediminis TaxID=3079856 RepID=UPI0029127913|nr:glycerophosphodiester phosphodiesterase family protein [Rhodophyticola sp. MJ-SS7]MDU8943943.1 glycerophosphodiester phosphodiesterase family protein [Rhodophyticola sp. MJ-SS7]